MVGDGLIREGLGRTADPSASLGMTKVGAVRSFGFVVWDGDQQNPALRAGGGPQD